VAARDLVPARPAERAAGPVAGRVAGPAPSSGAAPPGPRGAPLLDVQDLRVRFVPAGSPWRRRGGGFEAVAGISFSIDAGQTLALVGESGCGKTTTGKAIVQLLRRQARIEGRALLDGRDLFALEGEALRAARRDVQIVFQDPFASLDPRMPVRELLEEGLRALCPELDAAGRGERIAALVERVGLRRDALDRFPHEFSGGQRQRIAIARALAVQPRRASAGAGGCPAGPLETRPRLHPRAVARRPAGRWRRACPGRSAALTAVLGLAPPGLEDRKKRAVSVARFQQAAASRPAVAAGLAARADMACLRKSMEVLEKKEVSWISSASLGPARTRGYLA